MESFVKQIADLLEIKEPCIVHTPRYFLDFQIVSHYNEQFNELYISKKLNNYMASFSIAYELRHIWQKIHCPHFFELLMTKVTRFRRILRI